MFVEKRYPCACMHAARITQKKRVSVCTKVSLRVHKNKRVSLCAHKTPEHIRSFEQKEGVSVHSQDSLSVNNATRRAVEIGSLE
jgi:hypothetical protein